MTGAREVGYVGGRMEYSAIKIFNIESELKLSPSRRNLFAFISLLIIILSIYSNTFDASWHFDDLSNIQNREAIQLSHFSWPEIKKTLFRQNGPSQGKFYRPVVNFTFALNYYFGGLNVFGYHLANISVHIIASIFLFLFIYHTLNLPLLKPRYGPSSYFIALFATVFWAINPVQTQAITYIVQRMASMAAMFYIVSMYFYLKGRISQNKSRKYFYFSMCFLAGILAVGSKENAVMLPVSIFIYDLFLVQGITKTSLKKNVSVLLILISVCLLFTLMLKGPSFFDLNKILDPYAKTRPFSLVERLLTEPRIILFYLSLLFYPMPHRLSISHDIAISHNIIDPPTTVLAIGIILGILVASFFYARRRPLIAYCIIFFFLNHVIEGTVFGLELIFEHRNYLPSMLLFIPLAVLLVKGVQFYDHRKRMQVILIAFIILVLIGVGHGTFMRNFVWQTDVRLWADAKRKAPDLTRPRINLGIRYLSLGMQDEARAEFFQGLKGKISNNTTDKATVLYNIGRMYHLEGETEKAIDYYKRALAVHPGDAKTHNNFGMLLVEKGQLKEALLEFRKAILNDEHNSAIWRNFSLVLLKAGYLEKAVEFMDMGVQRWPHETSLLGAAGYCHRLSGSFGKAYLLFRQALKFESCDPKVHLYLAEIYFKRGMDDVAGKEIQKFTGEGGDSDILGYVKGTTEETHIHMIQPYKQRVMSGLANAYEKAACNLKKKAEYLNGGISPIQKSLVEDEFLSHMPSEQRVRDFSEDYPSALSQRLGSMSNGQ